MTVDLIRRKVKAFNHFFELNGGYKSYELQCIEVCLKEIDRLTSIMDGAFL